MDFYPNQQKNGLDQRDPNNRKFNFSSSECVLTNVDGNPDIKSQYRFMIENLDVDKYFMWMIK